MMTLTRTYIIITPKNIFAKSDKLSNKQGIHLIMSLFFFLFINDMNFCMELSKTEFTARVSFTYGTSENCLWPSPTVCVDVGVKV